MPSNGIKSRKVEEKRKSMRQVATKFEKLKRRKPQEKPRKEKKENFNENLWGAVLVNIVTYFYGLLDFLCDQVNFLCGLFEILCGQPDFLYGQLVTFYMVKMTFYMVNL